LLWVLVVLGSIAGALAFGLRRDWLGFALFSAATILATAQLVRIRVRARGAGGKRPGRRW
jgi:hypothetical protein